MGVLFSPGFFIASHGLLSKCIDGLLMLRYCVVRASKRWLQGQLPKCDGTGVDVGS